jgi:hypothetical protein
MIYFYLNIFLLILILENIRRNILFSITFGPLIALAFLIENSLAPSVLNAFYSPKYFNLGDPYFLDYPIKEYFIFATSSSFVLFWALRSKKKSNTIEHLFIDNGIKPNHILIIYLIGLVVQLLNLTSLFFMSQITYFIVVIYVLTFNHQVKIIKNSVRIIGILYLLAESNRSGMFGSLISGLIIFSIYTAHKNYKDNSKNPSIFSFYFSCLIGFFLLSFSQLYKTATRAEIWEESFHESNTAQRTSQIFQNQNPLESEFYRPASSRLNQGWLVSLAMKKTENSGTYLMGETIINAIIIAITPRILWPEKPQAGGSDNIKKYTDLVLNKGTSMNIGTLGELFVNFGFYSIFAIFCWGKSIMLTLNYANKKIKHNKLYVYLLPFLFLGFLGSGNDIAMQLTHAFKSTIFVAALNKFLS